ncbi:actin cytoskeleton and mitosis protein [Binucleata daphniae]
MNHYQELEDLKNQRLNQPENTGMLTGTCNDFCPRYEFLDRLHRKDINKFEIAKNNKEDVYILVKKYQRSAAGKTKAFCEDIRSLDALERTTTYLIKLLHHKNNNYNNKSNNNNYEYNIIQYDLEYSHELYKFIEDRLRAVRLDISVQSLCNIKTIKILQKIVNFYAISNFMLYNYQEFEMHINNEQLKRTMIDLMQMYKAMNINNAKDYEKYIRNETSGNANKYYKTDIKNKENNIVKDVDSIEDINMYNDFYYNIHEFEYDTFIDYYFLININDPESFTNLECSSLTKKLVIAYQQNDFYNFFSLYKKLDFTSLSILLANVQKLVINNIKLLKNNVRDLLEIQHIYKMFVLSKKEIKSILNKEGVEIVLENNKKIVNLREKSYNVKETKIERCLCKEIERRVIYNNQLLIYNGPVDKKIKSIILYQFCKEMLKEYISMNRDDNFRTENSKIAIDASSTLKNKNNTRTAETLQNNINTSIFADTPQTNVLQYNANTSIFADTPQNNTNISIFADAPQNNTNIRIFADAPQNNTKTRIFGDAPQNNTKTRIFGDKQQNYTNQYTIVDTRKNKSKQSNTRTVGNTKKNTINSDNNANTFCNIANFNLYDSTKLHENFHTNMVNNDKLIYKNTRMYECIKKMCFKYLMYKLLLNKQKNEILQENIKLTIKNMKKYKQHKKNILLVTKKQTNEIYEKLKTHFNFNVTYTKYEECENTAKYDKYDKYDIVLFYKCKPTKNTNCLVLNDKAVNDELIEKIYNSNNLNVYCNKKRRDAIKYLINNKNTGNSEIEKKIINLMYGL